MSAKSAMAVSVPAGALAASSFERYIARGLVFALAGVLVIEAAVTHRASQAGGIDKALLTLRNQPFGQVLLILAALGLIIFGIYGLCEARWRKV